MDDGKCQAAGSNVRHVLHVDHWLAAARELKMTECCGSSHVHQDTDIISKPLRSLSRCAPPAMASSPLLVFPPSPPRSGNVSPLIVPSNDLLVSSSYRSSRSLTSTRQRSNPSDSEGYSTETSPPLRKRAMSRAITLPSGSVPFTRAKSARSLFRTPSVSGSESSASSSTPTDGEDHPPPSHNHNPAIGRKVAASLDLFRETAEDLPRSESSSRADVISARKTGAVEHVPEAFEFVKRSDWADRENAVIRRERSATTVGKSNESSPLDVGQWRRDVAIARGRRRERDASDDVALSAAISNLHDASVRYVPQRPCGYPPSPSPSRSPINRLPLPRRHLPQEHVGPLPRPSDIPTPQHSRPSSPIHHQTSTQTPSISIPSLDPISPWTTDDESNWETASATATAASNSSMLGEFDDHHDYPLSSSFFHQSLPSQIKDSHGILSLEDDRNSRFLPSRDRTLDNPMFDLKESLPHIPLRPFRNKVGGHSAIYKFTKQAVCKVRIVLILHLFC